MVRRNKSPGRIIVVIFHDGLIFDLILRTSETFGGIRLLPLDSSEIVKAFCLAAHEAFELNNSLARTVSAVDRLGDGTLVLDIEARNIELVRGILGLTHGLVTAAALELWRKRNASETTNISADIIRVEETSGLREIDGFGTM